jgi:hypothetical protein
LLIDDEAGERSAVACPLALLGLAYPVPARRPAAARWRFHSDLASEALRSPRSL